jgi:hypothetical protein
VAEKIAALGCDPIEAMIKLAADSRTEIGIKAMLYRELASYCWPKRKAIEMTGAEGKPLMSELVDLMREIHESRNTSTLTGMIESRRLQALKPLTVFACFLVLF